MRVGRGEKYKHRYFGMKFVEKLIFLPACFRLAPCIFLTREERRSSKRQKERSTGGLSIIVRTFLPQSGTKWKREIIFIN